mmetsp:Transcript_49157/g.115566  ORF Transcript_49157/g.115566 Transcript_49157/m.115566 type:complete len:379 (+) Transcript_49157:31-1167(+)
MAAATKEWPTLVNFAWAHNSVSAFSHGSSKPCFTSFGKDVPGTAQWRQRGPAPSSWTSGRRRCGGVKDRPRGFRAVSAFESACLQDCSYSSRSRYHLGGEQAVCSCSANVTCLPPVVKAAPSSCFFKRRLLKSVGSFFSTERTWALLYWRALRAGLVFTLISAPAPKGLTSTFAHGLRVDSLSGVRIEPRVGVPRSLIILVGLVNSTLAGDRSIFEFRTSASFSLVRSRNGFLGGKSPVWALEGETVSRTSGSSSRKPRFIRPVCGPGLCFAGAMPRGSTVVVALAAGVFSRGFAAFPSRGAEKLRGTGLMGRPCEPLVKASLRPANRRSRAQSSAWERLSCSRMSSRCLSRNCSPRWETCCLSSDCTFCESVSSLFV